MLRLKGRGRSKIIPAVAVGLLLLTRAGLADASSDRYYYTRAHAEARAGNLDMAFMYYKTLARDPLSAYYPEALFAMAEYYAQIPDARTARQLFTEVVDQFPASPAALFAMAHLLRIAREQPNAEAVARWEERIIAAQQLGLVFQDVKTISYSSPLGLRYTARYTIDKITFLIGGKPLAEITY